MTRFLITYCLSLIVGNGIAQKQANTWYFGKRVGLDFNQSPPVVLLDGAATSLEGCASISDNNGKLLFYSNGLTVYNKMNLPMKNGNNILGDLSSTNNILFVPFPDNDSLYYLFTVGAQNQAAKGFRYSIVNIRGDEGFGEVVQKNVLIEDTIFEKLSAVKHCNKKDVWVTVHKQGTDQYHSYLVSAAGIGPTPVVSHSGFIPTNPIGTLKFSADGKKMAAVYSFETNVVELMDFDNTSGVLTNPVNFQPYALFSTDELYIHSYGAEFSPSNQFLYISSNTSDTEPSTLFQFNISAANPASILASKQVISQTSPWLAGGLQIGPDSKIYMCNYKDSSLSVIEDPDMPGLACNFNYNKVFVGFNFGDAMQFDFPSFIQSYFDPLSNPYDFSRSGNCLDRDIHFVINRLTGIDSVKWDFGDGSSSSVLSPVHHFDNPGFHTVNLIVYKMDCSGMNDNITQAIWIADRPDFLGADTGSCGQPNIPLGIDAITSAFYLWNTGEITSRINAGSFGAYWMRIEQAGCSVSDTVNVFSKPRPTVDLGRDTVVCQTQPIVLKATSASANAYLWNTGEITSSITIKGAGVYSVTVTGNSCTASDTIIVNWGDCPVLIPSAFTPNGDGLNDKFGVAGGFAAKDFLLQVFDRWGNTVFITSDNQQKWDGRVKGKIAPDGAYTWILKYTTPTGFKDFQKGSVLLIH